MALPSPAYSPLLNRDAFEDVGEKDLSNIPVDRCRADHQYSILKQYRQFAIQALLLAISVISLLVAVHALQKAPDCGCENRKEIWSPLWDVVEYELKTFDGAQVLAHQETNPFFGHPSDASDAAWDTLTGANGGVISISEAGLSKLNRSKSSVRLPDNLGGGYMAGVEVQHHLHCLDLIRRFTYREYYDDLSPKASDALYKVFHKDHCIETLRQKLLCDADVGIITYKFIKNHTQPYRDFSTKHQCRNSGKIYKWIEEHQVDVGGTISRPEDAEELELS